jgi:hypothetical protein
MTYFMAPYQQNSNNVSMCSSHRNKASSSDNYLLCQVQIKGRRTTYKLAGSYYCAYRRSVDLNYRDIFLKTGTTNTDVMTQLRKILYLFTQFQFHQDEERTQTFAADKVAATN